MTDEEYLEKAKLIWKNYVPTKGQSKYVQGELLRALAKLQEEAQINGNINWDEGFEILAMYLRNTIEGYKILKGNKLEKFKDDVDQLLIYTTPYTDDDLYKRLERAVVDFYIRFPEPIKHQFNPNLHR